MRPLILCLLLAAGAPLVRAEAPFRFESAPGKLPKNVVPVQYDIRLSPDIEKRTFTGSETIDIEIKTATDRCVLNAANLEISAAEITPAAPDDAKSSPVKPTLDADQQTCILAFAQELPPGNYRLALRFAGKINQDGTGLFATTYDAGGRQETMICTQMEPADARRVFPCWDEPAFRAKFGLAVEVSPAGWMAVSNLPPASRVATVGESQEWTFQTTPPMASYLVVLALGNFGTLEGEADGIPIRVVAPKDRVKNGKYALESAEKILHYYDEYFGLKYPLPKLDLIAISGGAPGGFGAMENWGGIAFAEEYLLFDPGASSQETKEYSFETIAHEMAHQWFGDLVTMGWWDNIWLNEGFAEWMGQSTTDRFNPDWQYWSSIATNKDRGMASDARSTTHPIQQPVVNEMDSLRSFDEITYNKGQSFVRMMENYLGPEKFRDGVRRYLKAHADGNTTTADLWAALDAASGQPVGAIAAPWTERPGFPLVSIARDPADPDKLRLTQRRFTVHDPHATPLRWPVPVTYLGVASDRKGSLLLDESATVPAAADGHPLKFNAGGTGYYRVAYDEATLRPLLDHINDLPAPDQNNLLNDAWAAVRADLGPVTTYLGIVRALRPADTNPLVWTQVTAVAMTIDGLYVGGDPAARTAWRQAMAAVLRPVLDHYGWQAAAPESAPVTELRSALIERLGFFDDPPVVAACRERFAAFLKDPGAVPPDVREAICDVVGRHADTAAYDALLARARQASGNEQALLFYGALAGAADPGLAQRTLNLTLNDDVPGVYLATLFSRVAYGGEQPAAALKFLLEHVDKIAVKIPPQLKALIVPILYASFTDASRADELENYARQAGAMADPGQVRKYAESIRTNAELKTRLLPEIGRWAAGR